MSRTIKIGTRGSMLALWQANWVKQELEREHGVTVELVTIKTIGDKITDVPLSKVGGKGLFVKEIEEALLDKRADIAVHSMKDVPTEFPEGLGLVCITEREDPRDIAITGSGGELLKLPKGSKVGTSSLRRRSQLLAVRPDFVIDDLRGNINTRIGKLEKGIYDAIILAGAGMRRVGWGEKITEYIDPELMLPAIGQGALGLETRTDDQETNELVSFLNHPETEAVVTAERALLKRLEGGCQVPIAAYGTIDDGVINLSGLVASIDGTRVIKDSSSAPADKAESLGRGLAETLLGKGGFEILKELYDVEPPPGGSKEDA